MMHYDELWITHTYTKIYGLLSLFQQTTVGGQFLSNDSPIFSYLFLGRLFSILQNHLVPRNNLHLRLSYGKFYSIFKYPIAETNKSVPSTMDEVLALP